MSSYSSEKSFVNDHDHDLGLVFELHRVSHFDEGFEGLQTVRACCDGRHTVGHSENQTWCRETIHTNTLYKNKVLMQERGETGS